MSARTVLLGYALAAIGFAAAGVVTALPAYVEATTLGGRGFTLGTQIAFLVAVLGLSVVSFARGRGLLPRERWGWLALGAGVLWGALVAAPAARLAGGGDLHPAFYVAAFGFPGVVALNAGLALLVGADARSVTRRVAAGAAVAGALAGLFLVWLTWMSYHRDPFYLTFQRFLLVLAWAGYAVACALAARDAPASSDR